MKNVYLYIILFSLSASLNKGGPRQEFQRPPVQTIRIHFRAVAGKDSLEYEKKYKNKWGEDYSVSRFRFYISHIILVNKNGEHAGLSSKSECFLVDFSDSGSTIISLPVTGGDYRQLQFLLGVDSNINTSGAHSGALDPLRGMFWTWNSGYINAKLEGVSSVSSQPAHTITYHIGGYRSPNNSARVITLQLEPENERATDLFITANTDAWFSGLRPIKIAETPGCMTPGELACSIADNYSRMFSLETPKKSSP